MVDNYAHRYDLGPVLAEYEFTRGRHTTAYAAMFGLGLWWRDGRVGRYGIALALGGGAIALWHMGLYVGLVPERVQPCTATGPSCTDDNQLVFGIPIPLMALAAFALIGALSALSLKDTRT